MLVESSVVEQRYHAVRVEDGGHGRVRGLKPGTGMLARYEAASSNGFRRYVVETPLQRGRKARPPATV